MMMFLPIIVGIVQFGLFLHVRNTMVACAGEGARTAANSGVGLAAGEQVTTQCIVSALNPRFAERVTARPGRVGSQPIVVVEARGNMPALGYFGPGIDFSVHGRAVDEPEVP